MDKKYEKPAELVRDNSVTWFELDDEGRRTRRVKFTSQEEERLPPLVSVPKMMSKDSPELMNEMKRASLECLHAYEYEYIEGELLDESLSLDDQKFYSILIMASEIFGANLFIRDTFIQNVVITKRKAFYIDLGGIEPLNQKHQVFPFDVDGDSEERKLNETYDTEAFVIFRLADNLKKTKTIGLTDKAKQILEKMHSMRKDLRFKTFGDVIGEWNA